MVTGGNGGIGLGFAKGCAQMGGDIAIWARNAEKNAAAKAELLEAGAGRVETYIVDVSSEDAIIDGYAQLMADFGRLDCVFANSGAAAALQIGVRHADASTGTNSRRSRCTARSSPCAKARGMMVERAKAGEPGGSLVACGSGSLYQGLPGKMEYAASKCGAEAVIRCLAVELGEYGIRANVVAPGLIITPMMGPDPDAGGQGAQRHLRPADADARVWAIGTDFEGIGAYLCSDASSFMSRRDVYRRRRLQDPRRRRRDVLWENDDESAQHPRSRRRPARRLRPSRARPQGRRRQDEGRRHLRQRPQLHQARRHHARARRRHSDRPRRRGRSAARRQRSAGIKPGDAGDHQPDEHAQQCRQRRAGRRFRRRTAGARGAARRFDPADPRRRALRGRRDVRAARRRHARGQPGGGQGRRQGRGVRLRADRARHDPVAGRSRDHRRRRLRSRRRAPRARAGPRRARRVRSARSRSLRDAWASCTARKCACTSRPSAPMPSSMPPARRSIPAAGHRIGKYHARHCHHRGLLRSRSSCRSAPC